ncbi:MAG: stalk domain-containing protein [Defluviitaleaceae bacterium]|nr:stalk domain-containing protein [Defluviitaleaceae bacterium]
MKLRTMRKRALAWVLAVLMVVAMLPTAAFAQDEYQNGDVTYENGYENGYENSYENGYENNYENGYENSEEDYEENYENGEENVYEPPVVEESAPCAVEELNNALGELNDAMEEMQNAANDIQDELAALEDALAALPDQDCDDFDADAQAELQNAREELRAQLEEKLAALEAAGEEAEAIRAALLALLGEDEDFIPIMPFALPATPHNIPNRATLLAHSDFHWSLREAADVPTAAFVAGAGGNVAVSGTQDSHVVTFAGFTSHNIAGTQINFALLPGNIAAGDIVYIAGRVYPNTPGAGQAAGQFEFAGREIHATLNGAGNSLPPAFVQENIALAGATAAFTSNLWSWDNQMDTIGFTFTIDDLIVLVNSDPYFDERDALNTAIATASLRVQQAYTGETWTAFADALGDARDGATTDTTGAGAIMDGLREDLVAAQAALALVPASAQWQDVLDSDFVSARGNTVTLRGLQAGIHISGRAGNNQGLNFDLDEIRDAYYDRTGNATVPTMAITVRAAQAGQFSFQASTGTSQSVTAAHGTVTLNIANSVTNNSPGWDNNGNNLPFLTTADNLFGDFIVTGVTVGAFELYELLSSQVEAADAPAILAAAEVAILDAVDALLDSGYLPAGTTATTLFNTTITSALNAFNATSPVPVQVSSQLTFADFEVDGTITLYILADNISDSATNISRTPTEINFPVFDPAAMTPLQRLNAAVASVTAYIATDDFADPFFAGSAAVIAAINAHLAAGVAQGYSEVEASAPTALTVVAVVHGTEGDNDGTDGEISGTIVLSLDGTPDQTVPISLSFPAIPFIPLPGDGIWELNITQALVDALNDGEDYGGLQRSANASNPITFAYVDGALAASARGAEWTGFDIQLFDLGLEEGYLYRLIVEGTSAEPFRLHFPLDNAPWNTPNVDGTVTGAYIDFDSVMPDVNGVSQTGDGHRIRVRTTGTANFTVTSAVIVNLGPDEGFEPPQLGEWERDGVIYVVEDIEVPEAGFYVVGRGVRTGASPGGAWGDTPLVDHEGEPLVLNPAENRYHLEAEVANVGRTAIFFGAGTQPNPSIGTVTVVDGEATLSAFLDPDTANFAAFVGDGSFALRCEGSLGGSLGFDIISFTITRYVRGEASATCPDDCNDCCGDCDYDGCTCTCECGDAPVVTPPRPPAGGGGFAVVRPVAPGAITPQPVAPVATVTELAAGETAATFTATNLQAVVAAGGDLVIVTDYATVTLPADAVAGILAAGGANFAVEVVVDTTAAGVSVSLSIEAGTTAVTALRIPITVQVPVEFDVTNHHRVVAMTANPQLIGGSFDPATGIFTFTTDRVGDFVISYQADLNRVSFAIGSTSITDLAGNNQGPGVMDAAPVIEGGRTLLPVRFMAYALGATISFDDATRQVSLAANGQTLTFGIDGQLTAQMQAMGMDVAPQVVNGRTMVPLRFVAEFFNAEVVWNDATRSVEVIKL